VARHLQKVYATLSGGILAATLGAFVHYKFHVAGMMTQLALFACIIGLMFVKGKFLLSEHAMYKQALFLKCAFKLLELRQPAYRRGKMPRGWR